MLGWDGVDPNVGEDAGGGVEVDAASYVLIVMTFWSIRSWIAPHRVKQLSIECPMTLWKL